MRLGSASSARSRRPGCNEVSLRDFIDGRRREHAAEGARHPEATGEPRNARAAEVRVAVGLRSMPVRYLFLDEVDAYLGAEGIGCDCLGLVRGVWRAIYG